MCSRLHDQIGPAASDPEILKPYRIVSEALDALHVGLCLFDGEDRTLLWNRSFLRLFPEHSGHVSVGEPYAENLRRFYTSRLRPDEIGSMEQCIAEGIVRHRTQTQPFIFEHRDQWVRVASDVVPGLGRLRIWTPIAAPRTASGMSIGPTGKLLMPEVMNFPAEDGDGASVTDSDGRILSVNTRFKHFFGLSDVKQTIGRTHAEIYATAWAGQDDKSGQATTGAQTLAEGERFSGAPFELPFPNGRWLRVLQQRAPDGQTFTTFGDITAAKAQQQSLREAREAAEAANKAKDGFLATVSHELRTPMNGILGMLDILDDGRLAADQAEQVGIARQSADALLGLLDDILAFSRIEAGHLTPDHLPSNPTTIVDEVIRLLQPRAAQKGLTLRWIADADVPETVQSDPARLRQILLNIVGNALKFTMTGGVAVSVRRGGEMTGGRVFLEFEVADTGIGIPEAALGQIFDPFSQADSGIARRFGGTGLGLAICRSLVQAMGGQITVESQPGVGSRFRFSILCGTVTGQGAARVATPVRAAAGLAGRRVLVADDHPTNRQVIRLHLERLGIQVISAAGGAEALAACAQPLDLILMDLEMPVMDGFAVARAIRSSALPAARTPIVALTAHVGEDIRMRCRAAGMQGFVSKPVRLAQLAEAIADAIIPLATDPPAMPGAVADGLISADLRNLVSEIGEANWKEILAEFCKVLLDDFNKLKKIIHDGSDHREILHRIKGSSRNVGAKKLADLAEAFENIPSNVISSRMEEFEIILIESTKALNRFGQH